MVFALVGTFVFALSGLTRDVLLGVLTGVSGGMRRDVLVAEVPRC